MSARDEYQPAGLSGEIGRPLWEQMCNEIDRLRNIIIDVAIEERLAGGGVWASDHECGIIWPEQQGGIEASRRE